jgi:glycine hydroxymethyltransferase
VNKPWADSLDDQLQALVDQESEHYLACIDLIAASNAPLRSVRDNAAWGVAQFRSAEGLPGKRPYAGTKVFDEIERLACERARLAFAAEHANVQPLSGSLANLAAFRAVLRPGQPLLAMRMQSGGHLSHSHPRNVVSSLYRVIPYEVSGQSGLIDYDSIRDLAIKERPGAIVAGFSAYPRVVEFDTLGNIAEEAGAVLVADVSHIAGLVLAGLHPNPCNVGAVVTSSVEKTLRGTRGGVVLCPLDRADAVDSAVFPGLQSSVGLAGLVSMASVFGHARTAAFRDYQIAVVQNAQTLCASLLEGGLPLLTGGTDTHLAIVLVGTLGLSGREAEQRLEAIGILSNRNWIPGDRRSGFEASGLRLGTPTITARGFARDEVQELGAIICRSLTQGRWTDALRDELADRVRELARRQRYTDTLRDLLPGATPESLQESVIPLAGSAS